MKFISWIVLATLSFGISACGEVNFPTKGYAKQFDTLPLEKIVLPEGFSIDIFATNVENARSMALSPKGTLFVGTRGQGDVYAIVDKNQDYKADKVYTIATGLKMPNGVAFRDGDLYVAEVNRILKYENIEKRLDNPPAPIVLNDTYPSETHHGWKYIAFGPDGKLYVPVGAPCNICESEDDIFNTITRINPDGSGREIVQRGIRNTVGFTWHPETGELWFTDNGRDWLGDDSPACELNHAPKDGMHFGYPYCHQGDLPDPKFGEKYPCSDFTPPVQQLGPHSAPLGLEFYTGNQFPDTYKHQVIIAEHGSWNRSTKIGYQLSLVTLEGSKATGYQPFAKGWLDETQDEPWGRPVDIEQLPDGSILVSDDFANAIYRISYQAPK
ncbi:MAG: sorbosone dehydrogenase family protein [Saprospiraceae bacterium]|nr:sorbosone dehydrogenase family protein [Saprospiraceae bacterium]MDP4822279.1 sorbosone dehydrogenase family protein [Saprospiraceae bacterium]MDP4999946.1 sorbosone dehydrogenase family protein [Saprospiraceae bacterium]